MRLHNRVLLSALLLLNVDMAFAEENSVPLHSSAELTAMVAPVALYPDDLVAVVLPAAAYPLQLVQAKRRLAESGQPDPSWDESVVAVMNYPEVVEFLNDDLDWTYSLGLAFINQETDLLDAVQDFRAQALTAGNLKSDAYQDVRVDENGSIVIAPKADDKLYVPYYEPERVVVHHVYPSYYYHPTPRPVYYYPYPANYAFNVGYFYGVGTYFSIGWQYRGLSLFYSNTAGHPYRGRRYAPQLHYFQPHARPRHYAGNRGNHYTPSRHTPVRHKPARRVTRQAGPTHRAGPSKNAPKRANNRPATRPANAGGGWAKSVRDAAQGKPARQRAATNPRQQKQAKALDQARKTANGANRQARQDKAPRQQRAAQSRTQPRVRQDSRQPRAMQSPRQRQTTQAPRQRQAVQAPRQQRAVQAPRQQQRAAQQPRQRASARTSNRPARAARSNGGQRAKAGGRLSGGRGQR